MDARSLQRAAAAGTLRLIDLAPPPRFAMSHPKGATNLPFGPGFVQFAANLPADVPIAVFAEHAVIANRAADELRRLGLRVEAVYDRGLEAWTAEGGEREGVARMSVDELARLVAERPPDLTVLDVREPYEWRSGVIPGARLISMGAVPQRLDELDPSHRIAVVCAHGNRSAQVSAWLGQQGFERVHNVPGGMALWLSAGHPTQAPPALA
jgi:rhodanese-related sulfurtransferase